MSTIQISNGVISRKRRTESIEDSVEPGCSKASAKESKSANNLEISLVDPVWETIDPTPDVHALFMLYNDMFFQGTLSGCEVKWSPRMTSCAGVCSYEGRGGLCSIRLSKPLLVLRPRKDLVETLLHEMIHAYLFVTVRNRDRESHGPEFQRHMRRINARSGTKITIYHTFYAEVANYKQHHWRCEGPCRNRPPFFGWVKRASNRAPGPNDLWWAQHQQTCGGKFVKVKEPEGYLNGKKLTAKEKSMNSKEGFRKSSYFPALTSTSPDKKGIFVGEGHVLGSSVSDQPCCSKDLFREQRFSNQAGSSQSVIDRYFHRQSSSGGIKSISLPNEKSSEVVGNSDCAMVSPNPSTAVMNDGVYVTCPVCQLQVLESRVNSHLDLCIT